MNDRERELTELVNDLARRLAIVSDLLTRAISGRRIEEQYYREFGGES